ncbi:cysteine rich repeat-containing protein [Methylocystis sp. ATCC 49242]|uniref:cysteine rich repeat-containing protein n=1 Tax=Methylocystis sp. ATCC 49242 TaxID=622637 RepID=UPI002110BDD5|nr:cysteine rich repeat-containing protein [Methylocystis sp. ATCC 49242]
MFSSASAGAVDKSPFSYCKADVERLCAGIEPGGGRLLQCLKGHKEEMSVACAQGLMTLKGKA